LKKIKKKSDKSKEIKSMTVETNLDIPKSDSSLTILPVTPNHEQTPNCRDATKEFSFPDKSDTLS
jgi:hypothetical protein